MQNDFITINHSPPYFSNNKFIVSFLENTLMTEAYEDVVPIKNSVPVRKMHEYWIPIWIHFGVLISPFTAQFLNKLM